MSDGEQKASGRGPSGTAAAVETVTLEVDGRTLTAAAGSSLLEVCREAGIPVPTLCHDPRLEAWGGCRLCMVEVEGARGPVASCSTPAAEGMVVRTDSERVLELRRTIVELLLSDHAMECMTCERNGACALQDAAYELQVTETPYVGERNEAPVDERDALILRDPAKCVRCGRCIRICEEVQAVGVLAWVGRGFETRVGTAFERELTDVGCESCGQCVSTCPVGALTARSRRFAGRMWETKTTETVCGYCGVGCTLLLETRGQEVVGVSSPLDRGVSGGNLCGKGRFGFGFIGHPERLTDPLVRRDGELVPVGWDEALPLVADRLRALREARGPDAIGGLASAKCTNEENFLFQKLMRTAIGTNNIDHCARL